LTLKKKDKARITAAEMKFFRKTAKYTLYDHKRNQDITKKLKTQLVFDKNQPQE
jgi:polyhydroxyalkanoate synthesis regulator protein